MPKPQAAFVMPPVLLDFANGTPLLVDVRVNPLSTQPFHAIFTLSYDPIHFVTNAGTPKTIELFPIAPTNPYGDDVYQFDLTIAKIIPQVAYADMTVSVISETGKSSEDKINIKVH
jgi:hypothetical protein